MTGVDISEQPHYPFAYVRADAMSFVGQHWRNFDAIHASPPCQAYTVGRHIHKSGGRHPDLVGRTRDALVRTGRPWVIENVTGAPLEKASMLCGLMFGLRVLRHRWFESSFLLMTPPHPRHPKGNLTNSNQGYSDGRHQFVTVAGHNFVRSAGAKAMGIDWMATRAELANAIPPAYTEFVGKQLLAALHNREVA